MLKMRKQVRMENAERNKEINSRTGKLPKDGKVVTELPKPQINADTLKIQLQVRTFLHLNSELFEWHFTHFEFSFRELFFNEAI